MRYPTFPYESQTRQPETREHQHERRSLGNRRCDIEVHRQVVSKALRTAVVKIHADVLANVRPACHRIEGERIKSPLAGARIRNGDQPLAAQWTSNAVCREPDAHIRLKAGDRSRTIRFG